MSSEPASTGSLPTRECTIKGNIFNKGAGVHRRPRQSDYDRTRITETRGERWFCSEADAQVAGWKPAVSQYPGRQKSPAISDRAQVVRARAIYREAKTWQTMTVSGSCRFGAARTETHFFASRRLSFIDRSPIAAAIPLRFAPGIPGTGEPAPGVVPGKPN